MQKNCWVLLQSDNPPTFPKQSSYQPLQRNYKLVAILIASFRITKQLQTVGDANHKYMCTGGVGKGF